MPRMAVVTSCGCYRTSLLNAFNHFLSPATVAGIETGGWAWTAWLLTLAAVLMAWEPSASLKDRFASARISLRQLYPKLALGRTYQGFIKALLAHSRVLLTTMSLSLRQQMPQLCAAHWDCQGWCALAVDGSRVECPRTAKNQKRLRRAGRKKTGPQLSVTTVYHMGTGLPWCYRVGPGTDSERNHLRFMQELLPPECLLVADAGFVGYDLLATILAGGRHFLIRVGSNITLLRKLGYYRLQQDNLVYLWPHVHRRRGWPPVVLRLSVLHDGRSPVYLVTDVLKETRLSDAQAGLLYRMRWGIEVFYRSFKQTLGRRKMCSDAPEQAQCELEWALLGLWLLSLAGVKRLLETGQEPLQLSVAEGLRAVRLAIRHGAFSPQARTLPRLLARAVRDCYQRQASKKARDWPHKKNEKPPGAPVFRIATALQVAQARARYETKQAG